MRTVKFLVKSEHTVSILLLTIGLSETSEHRTLCV